MRKINLFFIVMGMIICVFPSSGKQNDDQPVIEPDFKEMLLQAKKGFEERDFHTLGLLMGRTPSEEEKSGMNKYLDDLEAKGELVFQLGQFALFPEIKELPEWVTEAKFKFEYLNDSREIDLGAEFILKDNSWFIKDIDLTNMGELDDEEEKEWASTSSPLPAGGEETVDAGLTELVKKFASDFKEKNWDSIKKYSPYNDYYEISKLKKKEANFGELLSQFPYIGPIPAPARQVEVYLKGTLEGKEQTIEVYFQWRDKALKIQEISAYSKAGD